MLKEIKSLTMKREQELSYMQAIPSSNDLLLDKTKAFNKLKQSSEFTKVIFLSDSEVQFEYKENTYTAYVYTSHITRDLLKPVHILSDLENKRIDSCYKGLVVGLMFTSNYLECYFMQLKLLMTMIPNAVAIADYSSFELLSGRWAKMQIESNDLPKLSYLYRIDIEKDQDSLWIHSHGLKRCCGLDFEAFNISKNQKNYPEVALLKDICNRVLKNQIDFNSNLLFNVAENINILLEHGDDYYQYNNIDSKDRPKYHEDYGVVQLIIKEEKQFVKKSLSYVRELSSDYLTGLLKYNPESEREISQKRLNYMLQHANNYVAYVNYNKEKYNFLKVIEIKDDYVIAKNTKQENSETEKIKLNDINDWYLYVDGYIISADDIYYLTSNSASLSPIIEKNKEALLKQLHEWHQSGESDKIVGFLADKSSLDLELSNIYARALNNVGEYHKAIDILLLVRELGKDNADWFYNISFSHGSLNNFEKALAIINKALILFPNNLPLLKEQAVNIMYNGEYEEAKEIIKKIIADENKGVYFTDGESISLYNILDNCEYHITKKQHDEQLTKIKFLYNNGMYKKINSMLLGNLEFSDDLAFLYAKSLAIVGRTEEAINLMNSLDEKSSKWHDIMCEIFEILQDDKQLKEYKAKKQNLTEKLKQEQSEELLNKIYTMNQNSNFLNVYINKVNQVVVLLNSTMQIVRDAMDVCYEEYSDNILYLSNFADLLSQYIKHLNSNFDFSYTVETYYNVIKFTAKASDENVDFAKKAANDIYDLIIDKDLRKAMQVVKASVDWQDYDTSRVYDLNNDNEYDEFLFAINDLHNTMQYDKQVKLFCNQLELDYQLKQKYVCALNNHKDYDKALAILDTIQSEAREDKYISYLYAYAYISKKEYDKVFDYCRKIVSYVKNNFNFDEDNMVLCAYGLVELGKFEQAKKVLADINLDAEEHRFEFKEGLEHLLNKAPELRNSFNENMIVRKAERLVKEGNKQDAFKLIQDNEFTDDNAVASAYYVLIELEQYELAYKYLNLTQKQNQTDYWQYCKLCCMLFTGEYEDALAYSVEVFDYLQNCYYEYELKTRPLVVYGFALYAKKDMLKVKQILLKLWGSALEQYKYLLNLYETYTNSKLTNKDYDQYKEDIKNYS